jgi:hypothetical protein
VLASWRSGRALTAICQHTHALVRAATESGLSFQGPGPVAQQSGARA